MIEIGEDQETIYLTRGDAPVFNEIAFYLPLTEDESEKYQFKLTDKISFIVKEKKGYTKKEVLRIEGTLADFGEVEATYYPKIAFTPERTKVFDLLDKRKTYWYDIVLNDKTTILGYDQNGAKKLIVYPEAGERS